MYDIDGFKKQLAVHKNNLSTLEFQAAQFGSAVPLLIVNEISAQKEKIKEIQSLLDEATDGPKVISLEDTATEMTEQTPQQGNQSLQARLSDLQRELTDFRTVVLVKLAQIEIEIKQIRQEQDEIKGKGRIQPTGVALISVIFGVIFAILLFLVLLVAQKGV